MSNVWYPPEGMLGFSKESYEQNKFSAVLPVELPGGGRPNANFRRVFKAGISGWDVYALQVALNSHQKTFPIQEDGVIGPDPDKSETIQCILREQKNHHLTVDGIAGSATQAAICIIEARTAEQASRVPIGLLRGIGEGESGLYFAAVSGPNWNNSYDGGAIQENLTSSQIGSVSAWHRAFDLRWGFTDTGNKLRSKFDEYYGDPGAPTIKAGWYCAITYHNWPAAAEKMAAGQFDNWQYYAVDANGNGRYYGVDDPAYWVIAASGGRLSTARQWRDDYIVTKTAYVKNWTA